MKDYPLVSIGIPTFNRCHQLKIAIESIINQDYPNYELVISDNCSDDSTRRICFEYKEKYSFIKYFRNEKNYGAYFNFINVLRLSKGKYFMWLGDDDFISEGYISKCVSHLINDKSISLAIGNTFLKNRNYKLERKISGYLDNEVLIRLMKYYQNPHLNCPTYGLFERSFFKESFMPNTFSNDWHFVANLLCKGKFIVDHNIFIMRSEFGAAAKINDLYKLYKIPKIMGFIPLTPLFFIVTSFLKMFFIKKSLLRSFGGLRSLLILILIPFILIIKNLKTYNKQIIKNIFNLFLKR